MMNYWEVKKLGDIAEISSGGTPSRNKKEYWENGIIPWVKIKDIKENFISTTKEFITENGLKNSLVKLFKKGTLFYSILAICVLIIFVTFIMSKYYSQQAIESYKEIMMENDMSKFAKVKLKNCATFINGMAFKPIDWDVKGLPIVRIQNLTGTNKNFNYYSKEYNPKFEINNGDLLISWSASLGIFIWNNDKAILNQHIFKVVFYKIEINKKYFYFCILDVLEEMSEKTHGSVMRHITKGDFDNIEIPLPSLKKQERIVGILDELIQSALQKAFNPLKDNTKKNYQLPQG